MSVDRYDYDIAYDNENGRYEVETIKCDDGAMICFEHYAQLAEQLEQAKELAQAQHANIGRQAQVIEQQGSDLYDQSEEIDQSRDEIERQANRIEELEKDNKTLSGGIYRMLNETN